MVISVSYLRDEKLLEELRASEKRRCESPELVDRVIEVDDEWRKVTYTYQQLKRNLNDISKKIAMQAKIDPKSPEFQNLKKMAELKKQELPEYLKMIEECTERRDGLLKLVGNIVSLDTVASKDESLNEVLRSWVPSVYPWESRVGPDQIITTDPITMVKRPPWKILQHHEILRKLNGLELTKGIEVAGHRGFFLKGAGCLLNMALIQYGINFLVGKGYLPIQPPYFMKKNIMSECAELDDFEETLYCIQPLEKPETEQQKRDFDVNKLFLIATSEQPIAALHRNELYQAKQLPLKYAGISSCFRKEAGAHGKDLRGIFRVHQFQKVEQFCVTTAEKSVEMHEEMMKCSEEFYRSLGLPYRVLSIVAGALNKAASKKYDLEAWFPGYNDYRELVSCSNCTDYQSRNLNARYFTNDTSNRNFVHMLNGTLVASQRCLCCILENYQTDDGVIVPKALISYMNGTEFIPYEE